MAGTKRRYGSGVYRRGRIYWLKVLTPAAFVNHLPPFWRSSLRTTSAREAVAAGRIVRAALDMAFKAIEAGMQSGTMSREQAEAMIVAVGRRALASAEAMRALPGPRPEAAILAAQRAHAAEAEAWRGVLRRHALAAVLPLLAAAAAETGFDGLGQRPGPDLLREAAHMLGAVAEENARREDSLYAGDQDRMLARLEPRKAASSDPPRVTPSPVDRTVTSGTGPAVEPVRFTVITGGGVSRQSNDPGARPASGSAGSAACHRLPLAVAVSDAGESLPKAPAPTPLPDPSSAPND